MSNNSLKKLSHVYTEMFNIYLDFCPNYRRTLIDLNEIFDWLKGLELDKEFSGYPDFIILMEWFNSINVIKPFCVIHFPAKNTYLYSYNSHDIMINYIDKSNLKELFEEGILFFPEEIYNIESFFESKVEIWKHKKIRDEDKTKIIGNSKENPYEEKISVEEIRYFYHPLQFFQLLTYLKGSYHRDLLKKKIYKKFYWERRFNFNDGKIQYIKEDLDKKNMSVQDFINEKTSTGRSFHIFDKIFLEQHLWLIQKSLLLWLKIETIFGPQFYSSGTSPDVSMSFQIPDKISQEAVSLSWT